MAGWLFVAGCCCWHFCCPWITAVVGVSASAGRMRKLYYGQLPKHIWRRHSRCPFALRPPYIEIMYSLGNLRMASASYCVFSLLDVKYCSACEGAYVLADCRYIFLSLGAHMHAYVRACVRACMGVCARVGARVRTRTCMCVLMCVYTHIFRRTWLSVLEVFFMIINFCVVLSLGVVVSGGLAALCSNTKPYRTHR